MQVINNVYPDEQQRQALAEPGPEGPIYMIDLLEFKPKADALYADGVSALLVAAHRLRFITTLAW